MAVKASPEGIRKMDEIVTNKDLRRGEYAKIYQDINVNTRTIRDFLKGKPVGKDSAERIIKYLGFEREEIIPHAEWFKDLPQASLEDLWQELYNSARYEPQRLGVVPAQIATAAFDDDGEERFLTQVVSNSPVWIEMKVQAGGHLIFLDRDATGEIVLLSPSPFIPVTEVPTGRQRFPHANSTKRVFKPATLGDEVFLAVVLSELPNFDWLMVGEKCLRLDVEEMQELLSYVKKTEALELIRSQVKIVAA
jgi:hypothetical protein